MRARGVGVTAVVEPLSDRGNVGFPTIFYRRTYFFRRDGVVLHRTTSCYGFARGANWTKVLLWSTTSFDSARAQGAAEAALANTGNAQGAGNRPNRLIRVRPAAS